MVDMTRRCIRFWAIAITPSERMNSEHYKLHQIVLRYGMTFRARIFRIWRGDRMGKNFIVPDGVD